MRHINNADIDYICYVVRKYALHGTVTISEFPTGPTDVNVEEYIENNADNIRTHLDDTIQRHVCIKWLATMDVRFYRLTSDGCLQETTARFRTPLAILSDATMFDLHTIVREFLSSIEHFNKYGSGWTVDLILDFHITSAPFHPLTS